MIYELDPDWIERAIVRVMEWNLQQEIKEDEQDFFAFLSKKTKV